MVSSLSPRETGKDRTLKSAVYLLVETQIQEDQCSFSSGHETPEIKLFIFSGIFRDMFDFAPPIYMFLWTSIRLSTVDLTD